MSATPLFCLHLETFSRKKKKTHTQKTQKKQTTTTTDKTLKSVLNMGSSDSQIDKPQRGRHKRAELPEVNIITGANNINTEIASLTNRSSLFN